MADWSRTTFVERARAAYAVGFAGTGAVLTDRVRAGCAVAVSLAVEHATDPWVLESTLQLGALEGVWARTYARREKLYTAHGKTVSAAWRALTAQLDVAGLVADVRRRFGLAEDDTDAGRQQRERQADAIAAALAALAALLADTRDRKVRAVIGALENTVRDGLAEGFAGAIAITAARNGYRGAIDFDAAYADALAALTDLEQYEAQARGWLDRIRLAVGRDIGRRLARDAADGASADDMNRDGRDAADGALATAAFSDWALGAAFTIGALGVYAALDASQLDWITVGDTKVCATCRGYENSNPHAVFGTPQPPAHPHCRCVLEPSAPTTGLGRFARYLMEG